MSLWQGTPAYEDPRSQESRGPSSESSTTGLQVQSVAIEPSLFEQTMDYIAFPERHIDCSGVDCNGDAIAFPEEHLPCGQSHLQRAATKKNFSRKRWKFHGVKPNQNDPTTNIQRAPVLEQKREQPPVARQEESNFFIQRNNSLIDKNAAPQSGDELVVNHRAGLARKIHDILDNREEQDTLDYVFGNVEAFACNPGNSATGGAESAHLEAQSHEVLQPRDFEAEPFRIRRDRSLISVSSASTDSGKLHEPTKLDRTSSLSNSFGMSGLRQSNVHATAATVSKKKNVMARFQAAMRRSTKGEF
eukprot:Nitzschia sp. Nitz4//scaffold84_size84139//55510//56418//NITZ4_005204-RA/size84139-processed-gene-0.101-mRNA-1//-1//CDS//3329559051//1955//frame0